MFDESICRCDFSDLKKGEKNHSFFNIFTSDGSEPRLGSILSKKLVSARLVGFFKKLVLKKLAKMSLFEDFSKTEFVNHLFCFSLQ